MLGTSEGLSQIFHKCENLSCPLVAEGNKKYKYIFRIFIIRL